MSQYIHFTEQQKTQARQTDIAELLRSQGETLKRSGSESEWMDGGQKVTIRGNLWYHQYEQVGGDAVDFVRRFYNKSYPEAMEYLLGGSGGTLAVSPSVQKERKTVCTAAEERQYAAGVRLSPEPPGYRPGGAICLCS